MLSFGERLKQARVARGLSLRQLAERVGVSPMALSKYENDRVRPSAGVRQRLCEVLGVKPGYFTRPQQVTLECVEYRTRRRLGAKARAAVEARVAEFLERYLAAESIFEPGRLPVFSWPRCCERSIESVDDAEEVAEGLRQEWELGVDPIANLCEALEDRGLKVVLLPDAPADFDGFSCLANGTVPVVVSRQGDDLPGDRQRFNLAHELGHLLLKERVAEGLDLERVCHRFAGAFLVPRESVLMEVGPRRSWVTPRELHQLKHKWGLSMAAWLHRLKDLEVISASEYETSMRQFRRQGWHVREPGEQYPPEGTQRFLRLVERAVAEDLISVGRAGDFLNKPLYQVREELGWPEVSVV